MFLVNGAKSINPKGFTKILFASDSLLAAVKKKLTLKQESTNEKNFLMLELKDTSNK